MVDAICDKLTYLIKINVNGITDEKAEIINFGIKSIVSEITKFSILITIAYMLGILRYTLVALIGFGIYRSFAGGFHAKTHLECFLSTSFIVFSNVYISLNILPNVKNIELLYIIIFLTNCLIIYKYAPADVEEKPILSKRLRKRLKIQSYIVMGLVFFAALVVIDNRTITNMLILSTMFESLTMLPVSYKLMRCRHGCENMA